MLRKFNVTTGERSDAPMRQYAQRLDSHLGKVMRVNATFDHRFIDGFHASVMSRVLRQWIEHPYEHFDKL